MRWQSTWPSKDIFSRYALDYAKKVNDMTGGDLKIEVLPLAPWCPRSACSMRYPRACSTRPWRARLITTASRTALALWGSGPGYRMDANMLLSWHKYGGGKELSPSCMHRSARTVFVPYGPMRRNARLVQEPITKVDDLKGLKYRTVGISIRRVHSDGRRGQRVAGGEIVSAMESRPARCGRVQQRLVGSARLDSPMSQRSACCRATPERRAV